MTDGVEVRDDPNGPAGGRDPVRRTGRRGRLADPPRVRRPARLLPGVPGRPSPARPARPRAARRVAVAAVPRHARDLRVRGVLRPPGRTLLLPLAGPAGAPRRPRPACGRVPDRAGGGYPALRRVGSGPEGGQGAGAVRRAGGDPAEGTVPGPLPVRRVRPVASRPDV